MSKIKTMLAFVALTLCGGVWAATPVAVWDGDFNIPTKNGYTIDVNGNTNNGKNITIPTTSRKGVKVTGSADNRIYTIIVKASGYAPSQAQTTEVIVSTLNGTTEFTGFGARNDNYAYAVWSGGQWMSNGNPNRSTTANTVYSADTAHRYAVTYAYTKQGQAAQGTKLFFDGQVVASWSGLRGNTVDPAATAAVIGGPATQKDGLAAAQGMVIEAIAIFGNDATDDEIKGYTWPVDATLPAVDYSKWGNNPAVMTWNGTSTTFHNGPWKYFNLADGSDGAEVTTSNIPGQSAAVGSIWNIFCAAGNSYEKYVAPGYVLRLTSEKSGNLDAQYNNLALGGLIAEQGAKGYMFRSTGDRSTNLGNKTQDEDKKSLETWFEIRESVVFNREGAFTLHGPMNLNIAAGKVFDLNSERATTAVHQPTLDALTKAKLIMRGDGNLKVGTLVANGDVTLDFANLSIDRATPYIQGGLTVDDNTHFAFPAGLNAGVEYVLCSGTLTAPAIEVPTTIKVGDVAKKVRLTYNASNKAVTYAIDETAYWMPNTRKKDSDGIIDWTADDAWVVDEETGTTATWPTDGSGANLTVKLDAATIGGVKITGRVAVKEVIVECSDKAAHAFEFHNRTKDVEDDTTTNPANDCLTADVINMGTYKGNLGLKVPIVGPINFGDATHLIFKTGAAGGAASQAYPYTITGRVGAVEVDGNGEFIIPSSMYDVAFAPNSNATIVYNQEGKTVTGELSGEGKVAVETGTVTFGTKIGCAKGLTVESGKAIVSALGDANKDYYAKTLTVASGAELEINQNDWFKYNGTFTINLAGTITANTRQSIGANVTLNLANGAIINGTSSDNQGDWECYAGVGDGKLVVADGATATINRLGIRGANTVTVKGSNSILKLTDSIYGSGKVTLTEGITVNVATDKTVTFTEAADGKFIKMTENQDGSTSYELKTLAAVYNGQNYSTLQEAIDVAGPDHLAEITNIAADAVVPTGYRVKGGKVMTTATYYAHWTNAENAVGIVDLTTLPSSNNGQFHEQTIKPYTPSTDTEETAWGNGWYTKLGRGSGWTTPGYALRYTAELTGANKVLNASYTPLAIAGLIVEPGATGFGFKSANGNTDRYTEFGDTGKTTYSMICEDFSIWRKNNTKFIGTHELEIAADKTLHLNDSAQDSYSYNNDLGAAKVEANSCLKLVGGGTLSVFKLDVTASGASLDLSAYAKCNETAPISGTVVMDENTTLVLPAGMELGDTFKVATTITGTPGTVKLGEASLAYNRGVEIADGAVTIVKKVIAKIDETEYDSVDAALSDVTTEQTVEVLASDTASTTLAKVVNIVVKNGAVLTAGAENAFGATNSRVTVEAGGMVDLNGKNGLYHFTIAGSGIDGAGAIVNNASGISSFSSAGAVSLTLTDDATVGGTYWWGMWNNNSASLTLDGHTMTVKTHDVSNANYGFVFGNHATPTGTGTISIAPEGKLWLYAGGARDFGGLDFEIRSLSSVNYGGSITGTGTITLDCTGLTNVPAVSLANTWTGTVWIKNFNFVNTVPARTSGNRSGWFIEEYGNANSKVKLSNITGYPPKTNDITCAPEVILADDGATAAISMTAGYSGWTYAFSKISGSGTLGDNNNSATHRINVLDVSTFNGTIDTHNKIIAVGAGAASATASSGVVVFANATIDTTLGAMTVKPMISVDSVTLKVATLPTIDNPVTVFMANTVPADSLVQGEVTVKVGDEVQPGTFVLASTGTSIVVRPLGEGEVARYTIGGYKRMGGIYADRDVVIDGTGGVQTPSLTIAATGTLEIDPIKTPLYLTSTTAPTFAEGAKIKLAAKYAAFTKGVFTLLTWDGSNQATIPEGLFDMTSANGANVRVYQETYTTRVDSSTGAEKTYTTLKVDLDQNYVKPNLMVMPLGDSITEGSNPDGVANPNYRVILMAKLAAEGYNVKSTGFRKIKNWNQAGIYQPEEWSWHNGVSGQLLVSSQTRAGWRDALEATLDASDIPDVITFKIGTNDQQANRDIEKTFNEWVSVVKRIIAARPSTKIVVGSIMPFSNGGTWGSGETSWNSRLQKACENPTDYGIPTGYLFFAPLADNCPRTNSDGTSNFVDSLHPNWRGHEKNAETWLGAIKTALAAPVPGTYQPNEKTGALANVKTEYLKGFAHLATYAPKTKEYSYSNTTLPSNTTFDRVGYYMELKNSHSGNVRWVWVDMNNWNATKTFANIALPVTTTYLGEVTNLHVDTNDGGIEKILPTDMTRTGWLQFTAKNLNKDASATDAPDGFFKYDWNDAEKTAEDYGVMNIFLKNPTYIANGVEACRYGAQTLMAYSRWTQDKQQIGIGNCAIHGAPLVYGNIDTTVNYMETYNFERLNLDSYELASIEIWGEVPTTSLAIPTVTHATVAVTVDGEEVSVVDNAVKAPIGSTVVVTWTPAAGYYPTTIESVTINGVTAESTVDDPAVTLKKLVPLRKDQVASTMGDITGVVTVDAKEYVLAGTTLRFTAEANDGYKMEVVIVNNNRATADEGVYSVAVTEAMLEVAVSTVAIPAAQAGVSQNGARQPVITVTDLAAGATVQVVVQDGKKTHTYNATADSKGQASVVVSDTLTDNKAYTYTATVGSGESAVTTTGGFYTGSSTDWMKADVTGETEVIAGGSWTDKPTIDAKKYVLDGSAKPRFAATEAADTTDGKIVVFNQTVTFTSAVEEEDLVSMASTETTGAAGAITVANTSAGLRWMCLGRGEWHPFVGKSATPIVPVIPTTANLRFEYNPETKAVAYYVDGTLIGQGWAVKEGSTATPTFQGVTYIGSGELAKVVGTVEKKAETATLPAPAKGEPTVDPAFAIAVAGSGAATPADVAAVLATTPTDSDVTVAQAYALGATVEQAQKGFKLTVRGEDTDQPNTLKLVDGLTPRVGASGALVTRKVKTATTPADLKSVEATDPDSSDEEGVFITLPTTGDKVKYFKLEYSFK